MIKSERKEAKAKVAREKMVQHLEANGWQKCDGQDAWKIRNWKETILYRKWNMTFPDWEPKIVGRSSVWELIEKEKNSIQKDFLQQI
jgi:hypothetical protein